MVFVLRECVICESEGLIFIVEMKKTILTLTYLFLLIIFEKWEKTFNRFWNFVRK